MKRPLGFKFIVLVMSEFMTFEKLYLEDQNIILFDVINFDDFQNCFKSLRFKINSTILLGFNFGKPDENNNVLLKLEALVKFDPLIKGIVDFSKSAIINFPIFRLINNKFSSVSKDELIDVSENLNRLIEFSSKELERVKLVHEKLVPLRLDKLLSVEVTSKFGAGNSAGGDFFDIKKAGTKMLVFLCKSKSYIVSNVVMNVFEEFSKQEKFEMNELEDLLKMIYLETSAKKIQANRKEIDILVGQFDTKNLIFEGYNFGGADVIGQDEILVSSNELKLADDTLGTAKFEIKFQRGDKLMAISSGLRDNCDGKIEGVGYVEYLQKLFPEEAAKSFNQIFYQLKKNQSGIFLDYDTTLIHLEVSKNVIYQV